jgi:hypothetical protein
MLEQMQTLLKALEAGSYNAAPSTLTQGAALQIEDLSPVMHNVTFKDKHIKLQKEFSKYDAKTTLVQFDRQLDYGIFGASAQFEGGVGVEETSDYVRAVVPMSYYSHVRRVTIASNLVNTVDGVKAEDRAQKDAAMKIAGDIEFDIIQGQIGFSNAGVFDGNPTQLANIPNMIGIDTQIRQSDGEANTQDQMFSEFGSSLSVVLPANGTLTQSIVEDASVRSAMNLGAASKFLTDPIALSAYNKIAHAKERIMLAGSPQEATGAHLRTQWTSNAVVEMEGSRFLSGKTQPGRARSSAPAAPAIAVADAGAAGSLLSAGNYTYYATAVSLLGESVASTSQTVTVTAAGHSVTVTITPSSGAAYYNVYRGALGNSSVINAKFIGRIKQGSGSPVFTDLGNYSPGAVQAYLLDMEGFGLHELAPYSELKLAVADLSLPSASFRFLCTAAYEPRKSVIISNVNGQLS